MNTLRWVKASERLPDFVLHDKPTSDKVIIRFDGFTSIGSLYKVYDGKENVWFTMDDTFDEQLYLPVTHWMPLPQPPGSSLPANQNPVKQQEEKYGVWQLCPKCLGQGIVSKPPWIAADVHEWSATSTNFPCDVCNGSKILLAPSSLPASNVEPEGTIVHPTVQDALWHELNVLVGKFGLDGQITRSELMEELKSNYIISKKQ